MYIKQLYTNCLAQAAYYLESNGEAIVIDPMREPQPYADLAKERNVKIR
jgi:hydroxyacylglutathione hydrolase